MPGQSRHTADLPVNLLRSLADLIVQLGLDPNRLCLGLGFNLADLANPQSRVSIRQACLMIKRALDMTQGRDRGLGLDLSATESIASMGLVGYAMLTSATLGSAMHQYAAPDRRAFKLRKPRLPRADHAPGHLPFS